MAKTFKNLPRPGEAPAPKPISERDFFDLSDERIGEVTAVTSNTENIDNSSTNQKHSNKSNIGNTSNTNNTGNISNTVLTDITSPGTTTVPGGTTPDSGAASDGVRQTFVLSRGHLEQLRDYVHARRAQGEYTYSQKQALQEALELLFASAPTAPPRPAQARAQEQQHRQRIRQGRRSEAGK